MILKHILYFDRPVVVACDARCDKAWGINSRPRTTDDYFLTDDELGEVPADPGTYEGRDAKPVNPDERLNRWCCRECERCVKSDQNRDKGIVTLPDFSVRRKA